MELKSNIRSILVLRIFRRDFPTEVSFPKWPRANPKFQILDG